MLIKSETHVRNFRAWSGAVETLEAIREADKLDQLEDTLNDLYPEGMTDTELNDLLWFDEETVFEWLGMTAQETEEE